MKNKIELKKTIIYILCAIILATIVFSGFYHYQYRQYTNNFNNKIATIVTKLAQEYPKLTNSEIFEIINNDSNNFDKLDTQLNKLNQNNHICVINNSNKAKCLEKGYYLVEITKELNSTNIASIKKDIESGDIILINKTATLDDFKLMISQIKYHDLNIVYLSELITEENN